MVSIIVLAILQAAMKKAMLSLPLVLRRNTFSIKDLSDSLKQAN
jgi:hypothetical protein